MSHILPKRVPYVCKACRSSQTSRNALRAFSTSVKRSVTLREQLESRSAKSKPATSKTQQAQSEPLKNSRSIAEQAQDATAHVKAQERPGTRTSKAPDAAGSVSIVDAKQTLREIQEETLQILESGEVPSEDVLQRLLKRANSLAESLVSAQHAEPTPAASSPPPRQQRETKKSLLGDLDEAQPTSTPQIPQQARLPSAPTTTPSPFALPLQKTIYTLLEAPQTFISSPILHLYVDLSTTLSLPQYLPKIFHLYAHKPLAIANTNPPRYRQPWSRSPKYAVPLPLASRALDSAIQSRDLSLCISIIDTTVSTPQHKTSKFLRRAALPLTLAGSVVPLSYSLSRSAAATQLSWDPDTFFWMCMAGSGAYLGTMGTLLFITVTAWNDHHRRVRWVPGTTFSKRWFGEEERAFLDRVALRFGFGEVERWGEEGGMEWEGLRVECGRRWMDLDRSSLLPGML